MSVRLEDARRVISAAEKKAAQMGQRPTRHGHSTSRPRTWRRILSLAISSSASMRPITGAS